MSVSKNIANYINAKRGSGKVYPAPFAVKLHEEKNIVEPDISVICDKNKLTDKGCTGAPDWLRIFGGRHERRNQSKERLVGLCTLRRKDDEIQISMFRGDRSVHFKGI